MEQYSLPDITRLVVHITYRCNFACENCCNQVSQAPSKEDMTPQTIQKLIDDSIALKYPWTLIYLQGGEPTLHPQFQEICNLFEAYKKNHNPQVRLSIVTNGYSDKTKEAITYAEQHGYEIANSYKSKPVLDKTYQYPYTPVNVAPIDGDQPHTLGCFFAEMCGIAVNNQGFWECQVAAGAYRVFDFFKPICTELKDLNMEAVKLGMKEHCKYCGASLPIARVQGQVTSATWEKYLKIYNEKRKQHE